MRRREPDSSSRKGSRQRVTTQLWLSDRTSRRRPTWRSVDCRSPGEQKSQDGDSGFLRQLLGNANSHADRHGHSCPAAPAMQHSGGAELTAALRR
jgi:hypothetical protein